MNKKSKTKYFLLTAILVSAVFVLVGCNKKVEKENKENVPVEKTKKEGVDGYQEIEKLLVEKGEEYKIPEVDTTGWKTYENKEHHFSFQYPSDWEVVEDTLWGKKRVALNGINKDFSYETGEVTNYPITFDFTDKEELEESGKKTSITYIKDLIYEIEKETAKATEKDRTLEIKYVTIDSHQYLALELWKMNIYLVNSNEQILGINANINGDTVTNVAHGVMQTFHFTD